MIHAVRIDKIMIAIEVTTNSQQTIIAGNRDLSVLSAGITAVGELGGNNPASSESPDIFLEVGGLDPEQAIH
jgi:hypothetical protein